MQVLRNSRYVFRLPIRISKIFSSLPLHKKNVSMKLPAREGWNLNDRRFGNLPGRYQLPSSTCVARTNHYIPLRRFCWHKATFPQGVEKGDPIIFHLSRLCDTTTRHKSKIIAPISKITHRYRHKLHLNSSPSSQSLPPLLFFQPASYVVFFVVFS